MDLTWGIEEVLFGGVAVCDVGTGGHSDLSCRVTQGEEEEMRSVSVKCFILCFKKRRS